MKHYLLIPFLVFLSFSFSAPSYGQEQPSQERSTEAATNPSSRDSIRNGSKNFQSIDQASQDKELQNSPFSSNKESSPLYDPLNDPLLKETDDFQSKFMNMLFLLGLLIGFMLLASWFLRRMTRSRVTQLNESSAIKVLETRTLSPRATLYLLNVNGQDLLIAESANGIAHLASLSSYEEGEEPSLSEESRRELPPYFSDRSKP